MKAGDMVKTPRFLDCRIEKVFDTAKDARAEGYTEPTHYDNDPDWDVCGKHIGVNRMHFAAIRK